MTGQVGRWSARAAPVAFALAGVAVTGVARADGPTDQPQPSEWSDSERKGDLVFFGMYGGLSFASASRLGHRSSEGSEHVLESGLPARPSFAFGYDLAWWPYDFFGLDAYVEFFGLPMTPEPGRFDSCDGGSCRLERVVPYAGGGVGSGLNLRAAVPLRYVQPSVGIGLQVPTTFLATNDPVTRLDGIAADVGPALRGVGGINFFLDRSWRLMTEYHLDYRLAAIKAGHPLTTEGFMRHSVVLGFAGASEDFMKSPGGDKAVVVIGPFVAPTVFWVIGAIAKAAATGG